jgi:L-aspartate oxidase
VFADRAGRALATTLDSSASSELIPETSPVQDTGADAECEAIRDEMRRVMTADVGLQRSESSLLHAETELERLTTAAPLPAWRTHNQLLVARLITKAARRRRESRGGHRRTDYPPTPVKREVV